MPYWGGDGHGNSRAGKYGRSGSRSLDQGWKFASSEVALLCLNCLFFFPFFPFYDLRESVCTVCRYHMYLHMCVCVKKQKQVSTKLR